MKKKLKKGQKGNATNYITRRKALTKLQIGLADFRRLCILKGIFPRNPKKKAEGNLKTYYLNKDIQFLAHEPLLDKFREIRAYRKKIVRAKSRNEPGIVKSLLENKPTYTLDHIVRERYPSFNDALRDLDDALSMVFLFAALPAVGQIKSQRVQNCARLSLEFRHFVMQKHALRKVFASIKGLYYQVEIFGETITWLDPYRFAQKPPGDVDYRVLLTFLEFYECLLSFVNFKLYSSLGLVYPPSTLSYESLGSNLGLLVPKDAAGSGGKFGGNGTQKGSKVKKSSESIGAKVNVAAVVSGVLKGNDLKEDEDDDEGNVQEENEDSDNDAESEDDPVKLVFEGLCFFLGRETPVGSLDFIIKCMGGRVGWEGENSPFLSTYDGITHWVIDRPKIVGDRRMNVEYIQPQWIFDCVNSGFLLPVALYGPGAVLPPHLSPFVDDQEEGYTPAFREYIDRISKNDTSVTVDGVYGFIKNKENEPVDKEMNEAEKEGDSGESESEEKSEDESLESASEKEEEKEEADKKEADEITRNALGISRSDSGTPQSRQMAKKVEQKKMAIMMMSRKHRKLYETIHRGKQRKSKEIESVIQKRKSLDHKMRE